MITIINKVMYAVSYALIYPFRHLSAWIALIWISAVVAFLALLVFKYFSNQDRLAVAKQVVFARVLEFRLYRHDVWAVFGIFGRVLTATGGYLRYSMKPFLILFVPLVLLLIQCAGWFEWRPLFPGEQALVHAQAAEQVQAGATLTASPALVVETPGFTVSEGDQIVWRVKAVSPGDAAWVDVGGEEESIRKAVVISEQLVPVSPERVRGFWAALENPGERMLPKHSKWTAIRIDYPRRVFKMGHWHVHWIVALFLISMIFGLLLKVPMRVDF